MNEGSYMKVLIYPVCVSTLLNLIFLCNIVRVLVTKLRNGPAIGTRPTRAMIQAFRYFFYFVKKKITKAQIVLNIFRNILLSYSFSILNLISITVVIFENKKFFFLEQLCC